MMAVPILDLFCPPDTDELTLVFTRFCIAYVYWTTMLCNTWECDTPKGKDFLKKECCQDMQFCGDNCHTRYHETSKPPTSHCGVCQSLYETEKDIITSCCNTVLCKACSICFDLSECPFCHSRVYEHIESKVPQDRRCFGPGCVAVSKTVVPCKKCHLVKYCSWDCRKKVERIHRLRCCVKDSTLAENGSVKRILTLKLRKMQLETHDINEKYLNIITK